MPQNDTAARRTGIGLVVAMLALASCGRSEVANFPATSPALPFALATHASLSGERFSANGAKSSCSTGAGTFDVSGEAHGPFPGTFTAHGTLTSGEILSESFRIRSGSKVISGSAESQGSGSPTSECKNGKLTFVFPIVQYRERHGKAHGSGHESLYRGRFKEGFN